MSPPGSDLDDAAMERLMQTSVDQNLSRIQDLSCPADACKDTLAIAIAEQGIAEQH